MFRFYRYILYRYYTDAIKRKVSTPAYNTVLLMTLIHTWQGLALVFVVDAIYPDFMPTTDGTQKTNKVKVILIYFIAVTIYYFLFATKKKMEQYVQEFQDESEALRKKGTIRLRLFDVGTLVLGTAYLFFYIYITK